MALFSFCSCAYSPIDSSETVRVIIEEGQSFVASPSYVDIPKGQDALFKITLEEGYEIESVSYPSYSISSSENIRLLTLEKVSYSTVITLSLKEMEESSSSIFTTESLEESSEVTSKEDDDVPHIDMGGYSPQLRVNAPILNRRFEKEGYLQVGWSKEKDGSGDFIGFGWRIDKDIQKIYPIFEKESDPSLFGYREVENGFRIKSYSGDEEKLVVPSIYKKKPIVGIDAEAISSIHTKSLILPPSIIEVAKYAIDCPNLTSLTIFDSTLSIKNLSLNCPKLERLRVNAAIKPRYSDTYFATFQNKVDFLLENKDKKKLILFSGSSTRYGFDSPTVEKAFPDYRVINMGVYAYTNAFPQLEIILSYLKEGDVMFHSPELDAVYEQFCYDLAFDFRTWNLLESGYQELERLDLRRFENVFDTFSTYQSVRKAMKEKDHTIWAYLYDDDSVKHEFPIYNENGDLTLYRANTEGYVGPISQQILDYRIDSLFGQYIEIAKHLDGIYREYMERKGIQIYFGHAPKNRYCLEQTGTEDDRKAIDEYLLQNLSVPIIMDLESSIYDTKYFYLIDNHLSSEGVEIHTDKVISFLKAAGL
ncbi:MAG: hypothetical protein K6B65_06285 [Bacilli bacterium]|nr:hypothetical protein [Bacilli bacterium]